MLEDVSVICSVFVECFDVMVDVYIGINFEVVLEGGLIDKVIYCEVFLNEMWE